MIVNKHPRNANRHLEKHQIHFSSSNGLIVLLLMHFQSVRQFLEAANRLVDFGRFYFRFFAFFPYKRNMNIVREQKQI